MRLARAPLPRGRGAAARVSVSAEGRKGGGYFLMLSDWTVLRNSLMLSEWTAGWSNGPEKRRKAEEGTGRVGKN